MMDKELLLTDSEIRLAEKCLSKALEYGAYKARVSAAKSVSDEFKTLNGELDSVTHCLDRGLSLNVFVDGRYGTFTTNRLDETQMDDFVRKAIQTTRLLEEDRCNDLPDPARTAKDAITGNELELCDDSYGEMTSERRRKIALESAVFNEYKDRSLISEEGEYSDSASDRLILDTQGLRARQSETSFSYGCESTIKDTEGNKISGYWWDRSSRLGDLDFRNISNKAYSLAMAQAGPKKISSGKYSIVVDPNCASTLVNPLLNALSAYSINQKRSFLIDSLGKKVFSDGLSMIDDPRRIGENGSRLFDAEGVAATKAPIIEKGIVSEYFVSTYMSNKMGMAPTISNPSRPLLMPFKVDGGRDAVMEHIGDGLLITGFNGGNSNPSTGAFSFGVEGFIFRNGKIVHPVREVLLTGNFMDLWNHLEAAGNDPRRCMSKLIPTLAFLNADISA
jgi:PmbA protein